MLISSILEALGVELNERYENVRYEIKEYAGTVCSRRNAVNPSADVFFSKDVEGYSAWRHALLVAVFSDRIEAIPGPLFKRNWRWGERKVFYLCDPQSIQNLLAIIDECGDGRAKVRETATETA